jgi:group I intron endonuclease
MPCGIYCFTNTTTNKRYIGQSADIERRLLDHWRLLSRGKDNCRLLQYAYNKYGKDVFEVKILAECDPQELDEFERYYISVFNTTNRDYGYNFSTGGSGGLLGHKKSEETKRRMSIANTKEKHPMWGKKHTEESRSKMKEKKGGAKSYQYGKKMPNAASKYYGVYPLRSKGYLYWTAQIKQGKTHIYIGSSKIEEDVARMYDEYIIENGLPNPLNFS